MNDAIMAAFIRGAGFPEKVVLETCHIDKKSVRYLVDYLKTMIGGQSRQERKIISGR